MIVCLSHLGLEITKYGICFSDLKVAKNSSYIDLIIGDADNIVENSIFIKNQVNKKVVVSQVWLWWYKVRTIGFYF